MLVDAEQSAAVEQPHDVPESGVGVLVEDRVGADQRSIPGAADFDVTHCDRDMVERREGRHKSGLYDPLSAACAGSHVPQIHSIAQYPDLAAG